MKKSVSFIVLIALALIPQCVLAGDSNNPFGGGNTPDGGTTVALLSAGLGGLAMARKYFRKP